MSHQSGDILGSIWADNTTLNRPHRTSVGFAAYNAVNTTVVVRSGEVGVCA